MRRMLILFLLLIPGACAWASSTLRVGSHVLVAGDTPARVVELLGKPAHRSHHRAWREGPRRGVGVLHRASEEWLYQRGDHVTTLTFVDGLLSDIEDRRR